MIRTVIDIFEACAQQHGHRPAMMWKRNGRWQTMAWGMYRDNAHRAARSMIKLGLQPGDGVSILGYNRPEWLISDIAAILAGGVPAGIYTTSSPEQCQYITDHADACIAIAENREYLDKFLQMRTQLPKVKAFVLMEGQVPSGVSGVYDWESFLALGESVSEDTLKARMAAQKPEDTCTLIYTSGTTGMPKAVMISHSNITWVGQVAMDVLGGSPSDQFFSYLPLSHVAEQGMTVHAPMWVGACVAFAESIEALGENLREIRPTIFLGVPRVWEKIQAKMMAAGAQASPVKKKIAKWAREQGLRGGQREQLGEMKGVRYGIAKRLVFDKVREKLGLDRCRLAVTAAAPISRETLDFFLSLGLPILEIYGMSECSGPATISLPNKYKTGKAGFCVPGAELKIAPDGEICIRGPHVFKGYYKNEAATRETMDQDGWLLTGDIGTLDADGFLQVTDRKKELLITAGGENIAPQVLEAHLRSIDGVGQAVVIGDRRRYLSALLALDVEKLPALIASVGSSATDLASAARCPKIRSYLQKQIESVNERLARVQTIKRFVVLPNELTVDGGELTPTMKFKRRVINEKYAHDIASMYDEDVKAARSA